MPRNAEVIRQWNILREIEASHWTTINELARKMEVTTRTIRRDLEALQVAGFPLFDELIEGKRHWKLDARPLKLLGNVGFTLSELCALYFSRTVLEVLSGTPFSQDLHNAFLKLETVLTPRMRQFLDRLPTVLQAKSEPIKKKIIDSGKLEETVAKLLDATLRRRQTTISYHSFSSNRTKEYLVEPYRLVYAEGGLYLVAYVPEYAEMRTFATERVKHLSLLDTTFEPTQGLSQELFSHSLGINQGKPESVKIEFTDRVAPYVREREWHPSQRISEHPDGSVSLSLQVCLDRALTRWILGFGPLARVVSPSHLAERIVGELEGARERYALQADLDIENNTKKQDSSDHSVSSIPHGPDTSKEERP